MTRVFTVSQSGATQIDWIDNKEHARRMILSFLSNIITPVKKQNSTDPQSIDNLVKEIVNRAVLA